MTYSWLEYLVADGVRLAVVMLSFNLLPQAKAKRRIVMGLREVSKHLKKKKITCIIISTNLEKIQSKGKEPYFMRLSITKEYKIQQKVKT